MSAPADLPPRWPECVEPAVSALRTARRSSAGATRTARAALWPLLHAALFAALRAQAGRVIAVSREDLEDLASAKALELLLRAEEGAWDPSGRSAGEVAGYIARVARHALIDLARRRGRECAGPEDAEMWSHAVTDRVPAPAGPEDHLAAREFVLALRTCVTGLSSRSRDAWFRRVFLERPSREIAGRLGISVAHVDVVVQRAREALKHCMQQKGHRDADARPGAFVALWSALSAELAGDETKETGGDEP